MDHVVTEQELLEQRLREQQKQSEEDSKWLLEKETNLVSLKEIKLNILTINPEFIINLFFLQQKKRLSISAVSDRSDSESPNPTLSHQNSLDQTSTQQVKKNFKL